jgi:hypothetical protein
MIIWSGWGFLVLVIGLACFILTEMSVGSLMQDDRYFRAHGWPKFVAGAVAAVLTWFIGRALNRARPGRGGSHSLFFIPMEYWAVLFLALGVLALFV